MNDDYDDDPENQHLGVTGPMGLADPTPHDLDLTAELVAALQSNNVFESEAEQNHRMDVLAKINDLMRTWIKDLGQQKNREVGDSVFVFGSCQLGVNSQGADMDILCVAPIYVRRSQFFDSFFQVLKRRREVTNLLSVETANVPLIKGVFDGIEFDMVFARLALATIPEDINFRDESLLLKLDEKSILSVNGKRATDEILEIVQNKESFKIALRAIRLWAKVKKIYSSILGYLGGVSWAILVARVCQLYPKAAPATIVHRFFLLFSKWHWPTPVLLKPLDTQRRHDLSGWDPVVNTSDRNLMPIITPVYPQKNAAVSITLSARTIIMEELVKGLNHVRQIAEGREEWRHLFEPSHFFNKYTQFIIVEASAEEEVEFKEWKGFVESKIRNLIVLLDKAWVVDLAQTWPDSYGPIHEREGQYVRMWIVGLAFSGIRNEETSIMEIKNVMNTFKDFLISKGDFLKIYQMGMRVKLFHLKKEELAKFLPPDTIKEHQISKRSSQPNEEVHQRSGQLTGAASSTATEASASNKPSEDEQVVKTVVVEKASGDQESDNKSETVVSSPPNKEASQTSGQDAAGKRPGSPLENDTRAKKPRHLDQQEDPYNQERPEEDPGNEG